MSSTQNSIIHSNREFVTVPETVLPNGTIVPEFKVGKYLSGHEGDQLVINETSTPWVNINFHDAKTEAKKAGLALITELQYLALAYNIAGVAVNWRSGVVGEGSLFQGLHKHSVSEAQPGNVEPEDIAERRWFELSNGDRIWDAAGNVFSWVFDDVQGDDVGLIKTPFCYDSTSLTTAPANSKEKGMGWYGFFGQPWVGYAICRGGYWNSCVDAGVFIINFVDPGEQRHHMGFRCTLP